MGVAPAGGFRNGVGIGQRPFSAVIPAKAGISPVRHGLQGGIPAFAGMTENDRVQPSVRSGESRGPVQKHAGFVSAFWAPAFAGVHISNVRYRPFAAAPPASGPSGTGRRRVATGPREVR